MQISKERYLELMVAEEILSRLEVGGIDNWEWYSDSIHHNGDIPIDEFEKNLAEKIGL